MSLGMEDRSAKSFWEKKEGTTGMITLALGAVGLYFAAPALISFADRMTNLIGSTMMMGAYGVALFIMLNIVFNSKVQTLVRYGFKSVMRWITKWFAEIDPIGIMKNYIDELVGKRETMADSRDKLKGQITVLQRQIDSNTSDYETSMAKAAVANKQGNAGQFKVQANQAGRMEKLNKESLVPLLTQLQLHLRAIDKYYEVTGTVIDDLRNEVKAREIERKMILASHSAMKAAKAILSGGTDAKELFDQAMEFVVEDFGMKMGEIDSFIENSKGFVEGLDMQNGVYEAEALKKLQAWEAKADSILLGNGKAQLLEHSAVISPLNTGIGVMPLNQSVDYAELLKK
jgi:hypothetical protein